MTAQPLKTYAAAFWSAQKDVALKIAGVDLRVLPLPLRMVLVLTDLSVALVVQALVNAGTITDTDVQAKLTEISSSTYTRLPDDLRAPDPESGYEPPDPDLGV